MKCGSHLIQALLSTPNRLGYVDQDGDDAYTVCVSSGDTLRWKSHAGAIKVEFPHGHPFEDLPGEPVLMALQNAFTNTVTVVDNVTAPVIYKYKVTITDQGGHDVADDPQILIDPGTGVYGAVSAQEKSTSGHTSHGGPTAEHPGQDHKGS